VIGIALGVVNVSLTKFMIVRTSKRCEIE